MKVRWKHIKIKDISKGKVKRCAFSPLLGFSGELHHDQHSYVTLLLVCGEHQPASTSFSRRNCWKVRVTFR